MLHDCSAQPSSCHRSKGATVGSTIEMRVQKCGMFAGARARIVGQSGGAQTQWKLSNGRAVQRNQEGVTWKVVPVGANPGTDQAELAPHAPDSGRSGEAGVSGGRGSTMYPPVFASLGFKTAESPSAAPAAGSVQSETAEHIIRSGHVWLPPNMHWTACDPRYRSSVWSPKFEAQNIFLGPKTSPWHSGTKNPDTNPKPGANQWIIFDFGSTLTMSAFRFDRLDKCARKW